MKNMGSGFVLSGSRMGDVSMGNKPLDNGGGNDNRPMKISFRDKVMDNIEKPPVKENLAKIVYEDDNPMKPMVIIEDSVFEGLCAPWKDALMVKHISR